MRAFLQTFGFGLFVLGLCYFMGTRRAAISVAVTMVLWILVELFTRWRSRRRMPPGPGTGE
jgi:uncharacterized membrane protein YqjE